MFKIETQERVLTELDFIRLQKLSRRTGGVPEIDAVLTDASVVPSKNVHPNIITMYSQVLVRLLAEGTSSTVTLCYPADSEPKTGFLSVLSPVGMALIGRKQGETAYWHCPKGLKRAAAVDAILFQPEASGDYLT